MPTGRATITSAAPPANSPSKSQLGTLAATFLAVGSIDFNYAVGSHATAPTTLADLAHASSGPFGQADKMSVTRHPGAGTWDVGITFSPFDFSAFTIGDKVWICEIESGAPIGTTPLDVVLGPYTVVA